MGLHKAALLSFESRRGHASALERDQSASDRHLFIPVIARADAVMAIRNGESYAPERIAPYQQHRRYLLSFFDFLEIFSDVEIVIVEQMRLACPQHVLRLEILCFRCLQLADCPGNRTLIEKEG